MDHKDVRARINVGDPLNIYSRFRHRIGEPACIKVHNEIFLEIPSVPRYETVSAVITDGKAR